VGFVTSRHPCQSSASYRGHSTHPTLLAGIKASLTVRLTAEALDLTGCERHTVYRALTVMEQAGLIRVERRSGAYPQVTLLTVESIASDGAV
jgi:hypothetical protein